MAMQRGPSCAAFAGGCFWQTFLKGPIATRSSSGDFDCGSVVKWTTWCSGSLGSSALTHDLAESALKARPQKRTIGKKANEPEFKWRSDHAARL